MATEKEIEAERIKAGYSGKITPYIRAQLEKRADAHKDPTETKVDNHEKATRKTKKTVKKSSKKRIKSILKTIGRGAERTGSYLSECSVRYMEDDSRTEPIKQPTQRIPKKSVRKTPKKSVRKTPKKSVRKTPKKSIRKTPKKSLGKPKKRVSTEKTMRDIDDEIMRIM